MIATLLALLAFGSAQARELRPGKPIAPPVEQEVGIGAPAVRTARPITFAGSFLGNTPMAGVAGDFNFLPYASMGVGYGYFKIGGISGSFIPVFARGYVLTSNLSPFVETGVDFVTVKFNSSNSLLKSTFHGTQWIIGGGMEHRFDFGLMLRASAIRFIQAKIWSPGVSIGYSIAVD